MMIRKLTAEDCDQLLYVLNRSFGTVYGREMDFVRELPKMWVRDDEHMSKHIGVFENGTLCAVVGVYPLPVRIAGEELTFATTGNVATLPEHEGKGYFTKLWMTAMEEVERNGYDAARLTGKRQRYSRYGYEPCGALYKFAFTAANRERAFGTSYEDVTFVQLTERDTDWLCFARELSNSKRFHVERYSDENERDVFLAMGAKSSTPYIALREEKPIGYVCANGGEKTITEIRAYNTADFMDMVCAWQARQGQTITVPAAPYMPQEFAALAACAQDMTLVSPSRFKIMNWEKVCNALMKLAAETRAMPVGEQLVRIEDYGTLRFFADETGVGCERADDRTVEVSLPKHKAAALLFGPFHPDVTMPKNPELRRWFPLPLSWDVLDYV